MEYDHRGWAVVDLDRLEENYHMLRSLLRQGCLYMAVVKANAYGHGDIKIAGFLQKLGVDWFAVATLEEAITLRNAGIERPILILGYTPPDCASILLKYNIVQTVFSPEYGNKLAQNAEKLGSRIKVQIKINSGMNRLGFHPEDDLENIVAVYQNPSFLCTGIFTHFAVADELTDKSKQATENQFHRFSKLCSRLDARRIYPGIRHCCNSAGGILHPEMHFDMVRFGIVNYGLPPSESLGGLLPLRPIMEFHSHIIMLKSIPAGEGVSYGLTDTLPKTRLIATVPVGYADGYPRRLSGLGEALVRGVEVTLAGRVCMDQMMLDVTDVADVSEGDLVTFVGTENGNTLTFDRMAQLSGTINYELSCALSSRVPRVYRRNGKIEK